MIIGKKTRDALFTLVFSTTLLAAPLVLASVATRDVTGQARATPATMGALEVATAAAVVPAPVPPASDPAAPSIPAGLALSIVRIP